MECGSQNTALHMKILSKFRVGENIESQKNNVIKGEENRNIIIERKETIENGVSEQNGKMLREKSITEYFGGLQAIGGGNLASKVGNSDSKVLNSKSLKKDRFSAGKKKKIKNEGPQNDFKGIKEYFETLTTLNSTNRLSGPSQLLVKTKPNEQTHRI